MGETTAGLSGDGKDQVGRGGNDTGERTTGAKAEMTDPAAGGGRGSGGGGGYRTSLLIVSVFSVKQKKCHQLSVRMEAGRLEVCRGRSEAAQLHEEPLRDA